MNGKRRRAARGRVRRQLEVQSRSASVGLGLPRTPPLWLPASEQRCAQGKKLSEESIAESAMSFRQELQNGLRSNARALNFMKLLLFITSASSRAGK